MTFQTEPPSAQSPTRQPLSPEAASLLARARKEWGQRQFDAAERSITQVLALAPDEAEAIRMLGMVAQRRGDHARAVDCFRRVLVAWPEDSDLRIGLGIALYEHGEIDEAITQLR
jgi:Flp pilus assembly protein TadD